MHVAPLNGVFKPLGRNSTPAKPLQHNAPVVRAGSPRFAGSLLEDFEYVLDFSVPVTGQTVNKASEILRMMAAKKKMTKDDGSIKLIINTPGGSVTQGFKLAGIMNQLDVPLDTIVMGTAASMGAVLLLGNNSKGRRFIDRYARIMIHQPSASELGGTSEEIVNHAKEIQKIRDTIDGLISTKTGLPLKQVQQMTSKDTYISPLRALKDGFVDYVIMDGDRGLDKSSIKGLTDAEIDRRDRFNQYDDLTAVTMDTKKSNPKLSPFGKKGGGGSIINLGGPKIAAEPEIGEPDEDQDKSPPTPKLNIAVPDGGHSITRTKGKGRHSRPPKLEFLA